MILTWALTLMGTVTTQTAESHFKAGLMGLKSGISENFARPFTQAVLNMGHLISTLISYSRALMLEIAVKSCSGLSSPEKPGKAEQMQTSR